MNRAMRMLIARGYWDTAGDDGGKDGAGGDAGNKDDAGDAGDKGGKSGSDDKGDGKGDDKGDAGDKGDKGDKGDAGSKLTETEAKLLRESMKRKEQINTLRGQVEELKKLEKFKDMDFDEVSKLVEAAKEAEIKELEDKQQWDKIKEQMKTEHEKELAQLKTELDEIKSNLGNKDTVIEKLTVGHSFDNSSFIGKELTLTPNKARIIYGSHFDIEDGQVVGYDKPRGEKGRAPLVDGSGENLKFEDAMKKIIDADPDRDNLIKSKARPGAASKTEGEKAPAETKAGKGMDRIKSALDKKAS